MNQIRNLCSGLILLSIVLIEGCATHPVRTNVTSPRKSQIQYVNPPQPSVFELAGKLSARARGKAISLTYNWQNSNQCTLVHVEAAFGFGSTNLKACPGSVTLTGPFTGEKQGTSMEQMLQEQTGYRMPLGAINYWLNGVPSNPTKAQIVLDSQRRTQSIEEDGWRAFLTYTGPDVKRPNRLEVTPLPETINGTNSVKPVPADSRLIFIINRRIEPL